MASIENVKEDIKKMIAAGQAQGVDPAELGVDIQQLVAASGYTQKELAGSKSKGKPKKKASVADIASLTGSSLAEIGGKGLTKFMGGALGFGAQRKLPEAAQAQLQPTTPGEQKYGMDVAPEIAGAISSPYNKIAGALGGGLGARAGVGAALAGAYTPIGEDTLTSRAGQAAAGGILGAALPIAGAKTGLEGAKGLSKGIGELFKKNSASYTKELAKSGGKKIPLQLVDDLYGKAAGVLEDFVDAPKAVSIKRAMDKIAKKGADMTFKDLHKIKTQFGELVFNSKNEAPASAARVWEEMAELTNKLGTKNYRRLNAATKNLYSKAKEANSVLLKRGLPSEANIKSKLEINQSEALKAIGKALGKDDRSLQMLQAYQRLLRAKAIANNPWVRSAAVVTGGGALLRKSIKGNSGGGSSSSGQGT